MPNMSPTKVPMPQQDPNVRNKNFEEVATGYTAEMAMEEATRCINCKNRPCMTGCPVNVPIPGFIEQVAAGNFEKAYEIITSENALPAICGRVCPQENQCEGKCIRGIKGESVSIGRLERFVADYHMAHGEKAELNIEKNGKRVAVVGSGPAGITCAGELAKKGYDVTIFEALHKAGGVLSYGIPEFRLPKSLVAKELENITDLGVDLETNVVIGRSLTVDDLFARGFDAVFLGTGAGLPNFLRIPGENLLGVYSANEFLTRVNQCEGKCIRGIKGESVSIGRLERFVADYHMAHGEKAELNIEKNGKRVAVVGSGPAGITCAGELAKKGYDVTIFEALHKAGGVLSYGIPEFRLPKSLVAKELENITDLGVDLETNVVIGRSLTVDDLFARGFDAVFLGTGAGLPNFLRIPGENLLGVYSANEFLTRVNLMKGYKKGEVPTPVKVGKRVAVVGAGNVAMDAARTAKRLGAEEVYIVYRRGAEEVPARKEEVEHAKEEGVIFKLLNNPVEIHGEDGWVTGIEVVAQELGEPDASGRRRPQPIEGSNTVIPVETVVIAIGQSPNPLIRQTTEGLETQKWGGIIVNEETGESTREHVYAGGDVVTGAATVILAMGAGKKAAKAIDESLKEM